MATHYILSHGAFVHRHTKQPYSAACADRGPMYPTAAQAQDALRRYKDAGCEDAQLHPLTSEQALAQYERRLGPAMFARIQASLMTKAKG